MLSMSFTSPLKVYANVLFINVSLALPRASSNRTPLECHVLFEWPLNVIYKWLQSELNLM